MAEMLDDVVLALVEQGDAITVEMEQLAQQPVIDPVRVAELAAQVRANTQRIRDMVPDAPPPPPPAP